MRIVYIRNPFSPARDRIVKLAEGGKTLGEYADAFVNELPGEAWIQIDGRTVQAEYQEARNELIKPDSTIVIMPKVAKGGGKNPFALIATIALSVVSMGVGNLIAGGAFFTAGGAVWGVTSYIAAAAVMFIGGSLIGKAFAPKIDSGKYSEEDPTYSWNGVQTMEGQGNGISITYGTVKSGGQSIAKFTSVKDDDQYLHWLVCAGEGPLTISGIKLNDNPVANYADVVVDTRPGTNTQDIITGFGDTIQSKVLGYELNNNEWRIDVSDGNSAEGIIIDLECSNGLYHANDDGSLGTAWIDVTAECAIDGTENWETIISGVPAIKKNPLGITLNGDSNIATYTINVKIDSEKYNRYYDEDDDRWYSTPNPHYGDYYVSINQNGKRHLFDSLRGIYYDDYSAYFTPGTTGTLDIGPFGADREVLEAKGSGYSTTLEVYKNGRISGAKAGAVRRQFRIDNLPAGKYKVRCKVNNRSADVSSPRDGVRIWWTMLSTVVYDDFVYPCKALIGIKAKATNQLSGGTPTLEFLKTRSTVWVYNPHAAAYEEKPADNPAWASYDFLHGAESLQDPRTKEFVFESRGVPADMMIYDQFKAWADNCDEMNLKINIEITQTADFWSLVNKQIAAVGRGMVLQFGTKFGCIYDHKSQPVQLFNMGNIIADSFNVSYMSIDDRANAVEISFINADKDYEKDTLVIFGDNYDTADIVGNPTQIAMDGITSYEQAYREGKYQLKCNELMQKTISFQADIEAIGCMVGDMILVSHDVPQWAISGRIERVDGMTTLLLPIDPDEITFPVDETAIMIRTSDGELLTYAVDSITGTYGSVFLVVKGSLDVNHLPKQYDLFSLGKVDATAKPFIVRSITRKDDLTRTIGAIEYVEGVFDENYDIPQPDYSLSTEQTVEDVINLSAYQIAYKNKAGQQLCKMFVSWQLPDGATADYFDILLSTNGGASYVMADSTQTMEVELDTQPFTEYFVKVIAIKGIRQSQGTVYGPVEAGIDVLPPDVTLLDSDRVATGTRRFWWQFEYPNPDDIAGFVIKYNQGNFITWDTAIPLHTGVITQQPFETQALRQGVHTVMIKAVDNAGQYSENIAYAVLDLGDPLEDNVLYKVDVAADGWEQTVHNGVVDNDGNMLAESNVAFWSDALAPFWTTPEAPFWKERYKAFAFSFQTTVPASGQFWLRYDITGPAKIEYRVVGKAPFWPSPDATFWNGEDNWAFWVDDTVMLKPYTGKVLVNAGDQVQVAVTAPENVYEATVLKELMLFVDVPDREEHFENLSVPAAGLELDIHTPNYYTTAVRIDAVQGSTAVPARVVIINRNPCKIQLLDGYGNPIAATVDITWQGFVKEVI